MENELKDLINDKDIMSSPSEIEKRKIIDPYGFIYITTNMINGKKYIGQRMFYRGWRTYLGSGKHLKNSIKKYNKINFNREIIAIAYSKEELDSLEIEFIDNHNAVESNDYYNIGIGGNTSMTGNHHSDEAKYKISQAQIGRESPMLGKQHTDESKQKMSDSSKGCIVTEETRKKLSDALKGEKSPCFGKHLSVETKKKISEYQTRITPEQINGIREKYATGKYTQCKLAEEYFIRSSTISRIVNFKGTYNH